jgi:hypothetical protein
MRLKEEINYFTQNAYIVVYMTPGTAAPLPPAGLRHCLLKQQATLRFVRI